MGRELAAPDWPPLTDGEVRAVLGSGDATVCWLSPRPLSAAALVRRGADCVFVKRHHVRVRNPEQLAAEHAFAGFLRSRGQPVPAVLNLGGSGGSVLRHRDFCYEAQEMAEGVDLYRDAVSWSPYLSAGHAHAAGAALARLHLAAAAFPLPARPPAALIDSCAVTRAASGDPAAELNRLIRDRPGVAGVLHRRSWGADLARWVLPVIERAARLSRPLPSQWGHGDWHPSNLTWTSAAPTAEVADILDLGLANRTCAVRDLAIALERSVVAWLDLAGTGPVAVDFAATDALLAGYQAVRPLSAAEAAALPAVLPAAHVEYALSEIEYFADVVASPANADLAYDYLIGHARWFAGPDGQALIARVAPS